MRIHHTALYTHDLEVMRAFYQTYFQAEAGNMYHNPKTGLKTYFLSFGGDAKLEIMSRPGLGEGDTALIRPGYIHLALSLGGKEAVDALTERLRKDGHTVVSGPRTTGDGYYESCVLDPEGNQIELVA